MALPSSAYSKRGLTLLEILIVVGVLSLISTASVLVLRPAEQLSKSRDGRRINNVSSIHQALSILRTTNTSATFGSSSVMYISVPDTSPTCANLGLPVATSGWSYACATEANYRKIDGTGWIPVDFTQLPGGAPFSILPTDPTNSVASRYYYLYTNAWELNTRLQSLTYGKNGTSDKVSTDGGDDDSLYEIGLSLTSAPAGAGGLGEGSIDATYRYAWAENGGWVDFGNGTVVVKDDKLEGYAEILSLTSDYLALDCATSPNGNICGTSDFSIANDGSGTLSGWAWNDEIGWVSFNSVNTSSSQAYSVTIGSDGNFSGYAWSEVIGWISFSCSNTNTCATVDYKVKTNWRP